MTATKPAGKILVVDDNEDILVAARLLLRSHAFAVHTENDPQNLSNLLANESYDVILLDMNFTRDVSSGQEGFRWLARILEIDPAAVVILITAYGDVEMAVRAVKAGATDFVIKPWQNEKLIATVSAAMSLHRSRREVDNLRERQSVLSADIDQPFQDFIGNSDGMRAVYETIRKVAATDANVLILGENGTGKELVARAVHRNSNRKDEVFIGVDVGAITETLFESELFGCVKGAFTDAITDRPGRMEVANGGTLFLDEIGNLPVSSQAKLLTALDKRQIMRVGADKPREIDVRLICATNMDVHKMARDETFRQDLLYRINTIEISLPPLRERQQDIGLLARHFLARYGQKYGKPRVKLTPGAVGLFERYSWPGNVRELKHALERGVILSQSNVLDTDDFRFISGEPVGGDIQLEGYNLDQVERLVILKAIRKYDGNISRAAQELGLTRASLYRRMQKHGI